MANAFDPFEPVRIANHVRELLHKVTLAKTYADYMTALDDATDQNSLPTWRNPLGATRGPFLTAAHVAGYTMEEAERRFDALNCVLHDAGVAVGKLPTAFVDGVRREMVQEGDTYRMADGCSWVYPSGPALHRLEQLWSTFNESDAIYAMARTIAGRADVPGQKDLADELFLGKQVLHPIMKKLTCMQPVTVNALKSVLTRTITDDTLEKNRVRINSILSDKKPEYQVVPLKNATPRTWLLRKN